MYFNRELRGSKPQPARRPAPDMPKIPEWLSPPEALIGAGVALDPVVIAGDRVALALTGVTAFPTGLLVNVALVARTPSPGLDWLEFLSVPPAAGPLDAHALGWGFDLGSLGRVGNDEDLGGLGLVSGGDAPTPPRHPVLNARQGSGGVFGAEMTCWLWPLPEEQFVFIVEWPGEGIPMVRRAIDVDLVRDAAARAVKVW